MKRKGRAARRGEERGSSTSRAEVLGVQLQQQQGTETAHLAEGFVALQAEDPRADATDARNPSGTNAEGTRGLSTRLEELLRFLSDSLAAENSGSMDTASSAVHDLEALETRPSAVRKAPAARDRKRSRRTNGGQSSRPVATAAEPRSAIRVTECLLRLTRPSSAVCWVSVTL